MKINQQLLHDVFMIQNPSHNRWCNDKAIETITKLAPEGCVVIRNRGNLLIRKGPSEGPHPHYIAHMDQVHNYEAGFSLVIKDGVMSALDGNRKQCGVGGDDKSGIYLAMMMLHTLPHCTAVFVRDEETSCEGSSEIPLEWFRHASFVIQSDRNNRTFDIIDETNGMNIASKDFLEAMLDLPTAKRAGHRQNTGSVTDVGQLAERGLEISMVNISSGYHNPHCRNETVNLAELEISCQLALEAGVQLGGKAWTHIPVSTWGSWASSWGKGSGTSKYDAEYYEKWASQYPLSKTKSLLPQDPDLVYGDEGPFYGDDDEDEVAQASIDYPSTPERERCIETLETMGYDRHYNRLDRVTTRTLAAMIDDILDEGDLDEYRHDMNEESVELDAVLTNADK